MPLPFHTSITGKTHSDITKGACEITGREDTILCQALDHEIYIPHNPQDGQPTGKRVHKEFTFTKSYDKSSPKLYQALCEGEELTDVTCKFYRMSGTAEEHYFTIQLKKAIIVSIKPWIANALDPTKQQFTHMEDVSCTYQEITWTYETGGVSAHDSWLQPKT